MTSAHSPSTAHNESHAQLSLSHLCACACTRSPGCAARVELMPIDACAPDWLRSAKIWAVRGVDGFRLIRCPFNAEAQLELACSALREWIEPPSANNLATAHGVSPAAAADQTRLWERHVEQPAESLLGKLKWATVGYQYQWTPRRYDPSCFSPFPEALERLGAELAGACGWPLHPEAAIINLYHPSSTMGGHKDDAEPNQSAPIVSISLGLDAIYLLGGETKETPPIAMRLHSGDVIVQGGRSRGYVHGVPRLLPGTLPPHLLPAAISEGCRAELAPFAEWLGAHRLNINVRQVFGDEVEDLSSGTPQADAEAPSQDAATARKRLRDAETSGSCQAEGSDG